MFRRLTHGSALHVAAITVIAAVVASWQIVRAMDIPSGPDDYNLVRWEVRNVANKWLYQLGAPFRDSLDDDEKSRKVQEFFALGQDIAGLQLATAQAEALGQPVDKETLATIDAKQERQQELENSVEATIEERVSAVLRDVGLERSWPLFSGFHFLFPPVDFEFEGPPRVLVISPRDRIFLQSRHLLRHDLTMEEINAIEDEKEKEGVSALVVITGGVGTYPSAVAPGPSYERAVELVAHEWLHQYFFFFPLGRRYFQDPDLTTINETVASIAGRELGQMVARRYYVPGSDEEAQQEEAAGNDEEAQPDEEETVDFGQVMRQLRIDVEGLLDEGDIEGAEALMDATRQFLAEHGRVIRKINQAYFAYYGTYADRPESVSTIGPKIEELRRLSPSLGDFIQTMAQVTSEDDLDALLGQGG
jgi:hypothetical protein